MGDLNTSRVNSDSKQRKKNIFIIIIVHLVEPQNLHINLSNNIYFIIISVSNTHVKVRDPTADGAMRRLCEISSAPF